MHVIWPSACHQDPLPPSSSRYDSHNIHASVTASVPALKADIVATAKFLHSPPTSICHPIQTHAGGYSTMALIPATSRNSANGCLSCSMSSISVACHVNISPLAIHRTEQVVSALLCMSKLQHVVCLKSTSCLLNYHNLCVVLLCVCFFSIFDSESRFSSSKQSQITNV